MHLMMTILQVIVYEEMEFAFNNNFINLSKISF